MTSVPTVESIIRTQGPLPAGDIKDRPLKAGLSEAAARKHISRAAGLLKRYTAFSLPKREAFIHFADQYGGYEFWEALLAAHTKRRSAYGIALQSLIARGGIVPVAHTDAITGAPRLLKKHISSPTLLKHLEAAEVLARDHDEEIGEYFRIDGRGCLATGHTLRQIKSRLCVEDIILKAIVNWSRELGLVSYDAVKRRTNSQTPQFGQFGWDITGPSYIFPLAGYTQSKLQPGFFVADVVFSEFNTDHIEYFLRKCESMRSLQNTRPFLPILIAERFSPEAFREGKQRGILFTTPDILLGKTIGSQLGELMRTLNNAAAVAAAHPDRVTKLLASLSEIEGAAINIRGSLFELIVGHLVLKGEGSSIDIGVPVTDAAGHIAEIDVRRVKGEHEIGIYECKGYQPSHEISCDEVDTWLTKKIPVIHGGLRREQRFADRRFSFEYWTSGKFAPDAITRLEKAQSQTKKYGINWKDGQQVLLYARSVKLSAMVKVLNEHYLKHPLSRSGNET